MLLVPFSVVFLNLLIVGNSKRQINFLPTAPSLANKMKTEHKTFRQVLTETTNEDVQFQPRNPSQVHYFKTSSAVGGKLGLDEFLVLHELAYMIPHFVWSITTFADLLVTCGINFFLDVLLKSSVCLMSYDTTFSLGDFYLSVLMAQVDCFNEQPCFPVGFLVHDRKFSSTHVEFFTQFKRQLDTTFNATIVTDGELAVINAVKQVFPHWNVVSCWNHILTDVEVWLQKRHIGGSEIAVYKSTVRELLMCASLKDLTMKYSTVSRTWSEAFKVYYDACLDSRVRTGACFHLKALNLPVDSITNNMSESFNSVIKRHIDWEEVSVDKMILVLHELQQTYKAQFIRSLRGFGPFTINRQKQCSKYSKKCSIVLLIHFNYVFQLKRKLTQSVVLSCCKV